MFDTQIFGQRLRAIREQKGASRRDLMDLLGVTRTQIGDMENGKAMTTLPKLVALAEYLHVSTDYLLGITDDPAWRGPEEEDS